MISTSKLCNKNTAITVKQVRATIFLIIWILKNMATGNSLCIHSAFFCKIFLKLCPNRKEVKHNKFLVVFNWKHHLFWRYWSNKGKDYIAIGVDRFSFIEERIIWLMEALSYRILLYQYVLSEKNVNKILIWLAQGAPTYANSKLFHPRTTTVNAVKQSTEWNLKVWNRPVHKF